MRALYAIYLIFLFFILLISENIKDIYAQKKYNEYNIKPFSLVPHPIRHKMIKENIIHINDIFAIILSLFLMKLIRHNININIPLML